MSSLELKNISYNILDKRILKNISGCFESAKITALVGPSGSGKTTLLKMCNALLSPLEGDIFLNDTNIKAIAPTTLRRRVGIALQSAPMLRSTVYANLCLPRELKGEKLSQEEAIRFLEDVGLPNELLLQDAHDLSGGQQQRVSIARTLVNQSEILLLDEITSALDRTAVNEIEALIKKINTKYGVTIVWITHNLQQAVDLADTIWILMDGVLVQQGTAEILQHPTLPKVKQFVEGVLL